MKKISAVLDKFLSSPNLISDVVPAAGEYYFRFGKHNFSLLERVQGDADFGRYSLYAYPGWEGSTANLADYLAHGPSNPDEIPMIAYHEATHFVSSDTEKLRRLYLLLEEKRFNMDAIFDDILGT